MFVYLLPSDMRSAFGTKFSRSDSYLARALRTLLILGPTRLTSLPSKPGGTLASFRPGFGSSVWQVPLGERGTPCAPGGHAWRDASRPAARPRSSGRPEREEKGPARTAGLTCASLTARARHVLRRASGTSSGVQPARLAARNRRVWRRAIGASRGAHPARLSGVQSAPSGAHRRAQGRAI